MGKPLGVAKEVRRWIIAQDPKAQSTGVGVVHHTSVEAFARRILRLAAGEVARDVKMHDEAIGECADDRWRREMHASAKAALLVAHDHLRSRARTPRRRGK